MDIAYTLIGFLVGFMVGLTGVGGGSLMTPTLVLFFGIAPSVAVGTDLLYATITKCVGIWVHHRQGTIRWRVVGLLTLGSVPAAIFTVLFLRNLSAYNVDYEQLITWTLSIALILTSIVLLFKDRIQSLNRTEHRSASGVIHQPLGEPLTVIVGTLIAVLVTLSSIGAGSLGIAILFFLYPRLPARVIVGTDLAYSVPLTCIAGLGYLHLGAVDFTLLAALLLGSLPGIYLGCRLGPQLPDRVVRPIMSSLLFIIGLRLAL